MINYKSIPLKEVGRVVTGKTPPTSDSENYGNEYMFISPTELHDGYNIKKSNKYITEKGMNTVKSCKLKSVSVLVGCIGSDMGNVGLTSETCVTNQQINSITDIKDTINPLYVYYWLKTKKQYLCSIASVTTTPILSKGVFESLKIPLPEKKVQDDVISVLNAYDRKIEVLKTENQLTLQFVMQVYLRMFWHKESNGTIDEILIENKKSDIQVGEAKNNNGDYPFFTSGEAVYAWDDCLISGRNIYLNTGGNAAIKYYVGDAAYSTDTWCISAVNNFSDYLYLLLLSMEPEINSKFFQGTGLKHLQKDLLKSKTIYIPNKDEIEIFNNTVSNLLTLTSENIREIKELEYQLDVLTPLMLNGQVHF